MTDPDTTRLRQGKPSVTAQGAAEGRAAHQLLDQPLIFEDGLALRILGEEGEASLRAGLTRHQTPFMRALRGQFVGRSRYAEDALAAAVDDGARQYAILGAGLDTYACRHSDGPVRVFEVDHPATQAFKRDRLAEAGFGIPASLSFAPIDFETEGLRDALSRAGFDHGAQAFVACLGVTYYLQQEAFYETLSWVASLARGSRLVFDFISPPTEQSAQMRSVLEQLTPSVSQQGEPLRSYFEPTALAARMLDLGFREAHAVSAAQVNATYFEPSGSQLRMGGYLMRACI